MTISSFRNRVARRRLGWPLAILLAAAPALGVCATMPMPAPAAGMAAAPTGTQQNMPGPCCLKFHPDAHAIAIPPNEARSQQFAPSGGHGAVSVAALVISTVKVNRSLRPPIRAPIASHRPLYLLNRVLLN